MRGQSPAFVLARIPRASNDWPDRSTMGRWALLMLACLAGCAAANQKDALDALKEAVEGYNHAFRWKSYDQAARFLPPDVRAEFVEKHENDENQLQVEDSSISNLIVHNENSATATIRMTYLMFPSVVVKKRTLTQHWHKIDSQWVLETEENSIELRPPAEQTKPSASEAKEAPEDAYWRSTEEDDDGLGSDHDD